MGFFIIMLMPRDINGLLKSITRSRSEVIVRGAIAISASCEWNKIIDVNINIKIINDVEVKY